MSVLHITEENFETEVLQSQKPVLVDFFATWCGPCKMIAPIVEEIAKEHPEVLVCKIDVDQAMGIAQAFGIESIPTLVMIKDGKVTSKTMGYQSKVDLLKFMGL